MQTVRTIETKNNTYYVGYGVTAKTSYEQQQEQKAELKYMIVQKAIGVLATVLSIVLICNGAAPALLLTIMGIALIFTKDHAIG